MKLAGKDIKFFFLICSVKRLHTYETINKFLCYGNGDNISALAKIFKTIK